MAPWKIKRIRFFVPTVIGPTRQNDWYKKMKSKDVIVMGDGANFADIKQVLWVI